MILLQGTTDILKFKLAATPAGGAGTLIAKVSWVDGKTAATFFTPGRDRVADNGTNYVSITGAPGASTCRGIKELSIVNTDTSAATVYVAVYDGTNTDVKMLATLYPNEALEYEEKRGFYTLDIYGNIKTSNANPPGLLINSFVKTSGTTFTTTTWTRRLFCRLKAGGGAGGGVTSSASTAAGGGGGSEGGYLEAWIAALPVTTYTYAVGAAGAGSSGADGGAGGNSTLAVGSTTYTANAGLGGKVGTAAAAGNALGGASPAVSTGDANNVTELNLTGEAGSPGFWTSATVAVSGKGGGPGGGNGRITTGTGNAAVGLGNGGAGACQVSAGGAQTGGAGTAGFVAVDEYS